ncbi:hypothetical protein DPMN_038779 [Dreissena polymorpha]|uniref:Uncharacterized protein n=1 Tax=Dreissena polymorpha TaxID=45954 RepID=A0A9D4MDE2_DREPO|nr:hypothetical protein DPMN_038779 [Dreissena polymorpha]
MASQLTIAIICLLLVAQITQIQTDFGISAIASIAAGVIAAGTSLAGTTIQGISSLGYKVTMGMEVENWTKFALMSPHVTRKSGVIQIPPVQIRPAQKEGFVARKTGYTATGSWGVVSWFVAEKRRRVVIMWSVPFNQNHYKNILAVGITKGDHYHNADWADQMYYRGSNWQLGFERAEYYHSLPTVSWEDTETGLIVAATMSTSHNAIVNVVVRSKNFSDLAKPIRDNLDPNQKK